MIEENQHTQENIKEESKQEQEIEISDEDNQDEDAYLPESELRRSTRVTAKPARYYEEYANVLDTEPMTREQALQGQDAEQWEQAMREEYQSLMKNRTWTLTDLPKGRNAIGTKWVFKLKTDQNGNPIRHKARLVAQGFRQKPGLDFQDTFAPVMSTVSLRMLLSLAAHEDQEIHQMDVETAYLNGEIEEEIYIKQPSGFVQKGNEHRVCRLQKAIYGLRQSGRSWWVTISRFLKELGFKYLVTDQCIFQRRLGRNEITIGIYVDDLIIMSKAPSEITKIKGDLSKQFRVKDLGEINYLLGMKFERNRKLRTITISQKTYILKMLKQFKMDNSKPVSTPMIVNAQLKAAEEKENIDYPYQQAVGALMYAATTTRIDILAAVTNVARFCSQPTHDHVIAVKRIFRYLQGTSSLGITLGGFETLTLETYADADWGSDVNDRRSTTGYILLHGGPVAWRTKRQPTVLWRSWGAAHLHQPRFIKTTRGRSH
jgi:hypothetical protein